MTRWLKNDRRAEGGRGLKSESADDDDDDDDEEEHEDDENEDEDEDDEGDENGVMLQSPHHSGNSRSYGSDAFFSWKNTRGSKRCSAWCPR